MRNKITRKSILTFEKMVFVNLDEKGDPAPHGRTQIRYAEEAFARYRESSRSATQAPVTNGEEAVERVEADTMH